MMKCGIILADSADLGLISDIHYIAFIHLKLRSRGNYAKTDHCESSAWLAFMCTYLIYTFHSIR